MLQVSHSAGAQEFFGSAMKNDDSSTAITRAELAAAMIASHEGQLEFHRSGNVLVSWLTSDSFTIPTVLRLWSYN